MRLTPPTIPVFLIAVVLAAVTVVDIYTHVPGGPSTWSRPTASAPWSPPS